MTTEEELVVYKEWVVFNIMAMDLNQLDETKSKRFIEFIEDNKESPFISECFDIYEKIKGDHGYPSIEQVRVLAGC
tara:strand:- start:56 stop:283 length:228 start_codon:yes stop_codon:yes gene_type:complete